MRPFVIGELARPRGGGGGGGGFRHQTSVPPSKSNPEPTAASFHRRGMEWRITLAEVASGAWRRNVDGFLRYAQEVLSLQVP